jgi:hypothetical protein
MSLTPHAVTVTHTVQRTLNAYKTPQTDALPPQIPGA